jgi:hypothetical protein
LYNFYFTANLTKKKLGQFISIENSLSQKSKRLIVVKNKKTTLTLKEIKPFKILRTCSIDKSSTSFLKERLTL